MRYIFLWFFLYLFLHGNGQLITINGFVRDTEGEVLAMATVWDSISGIGTITNNEGYYQLKLNPSTVVLKCRFIGYDNYRQQLTVNSNTTFTIVMQQVSIATGEVCVKSKRPIHEQTLMGVTTLDVNTIKNVPSFLGQADVLKAVSILPGITGGRDGYSSMMVRGGDRGQNLILLDGVKLYNTNHFGGFVSSINTATVQHVDVYKGGFPARYGGRLSSVLDVKTRNGNRNKAQGEFTLGLINSSLSFDGPLGKRFSFLVAVRASYLDLVLQPLKYQERKKRWGQMVDYRFYDLNAKITFFQSANSNWSLQWFNGRDIYSAYTFDKRTSYHFDETRFGIAQNNSVVMLKNSSVLKPSLFLNSKVSYSGYSNVFKEWEKSTYTVKSYFERSYSSIINEFNIQSNLDYYAERNWVKTGISFSNYQFIPGLTQITDINDNAGDSVSVIKGLEYEDHTFETNVYVEDEIQLTPKSKLNIGGRGVMYVSDSSSYFRFEPRLSFRTLLGKNFSFKANYTFMNQFNHVIVNNVSGVEREIWLASTGEIPPQSASQFSMGFFGEIANAGIDFSLEGYHKKMKNVLEFRFPPGDFVNYNDFGSMVIKGGEGEAYGAEFQTRYENDRLSSSFSYVLSWNYRQFDQLNNGEKYPYLYDKRHEVNFLNLIKLNKRTSLSTNFIFSTGTPVTLPDGAVNEGPLNYTYFTYHSLNNYRLPNYHRLDIAINRKWMTRKQNESTFTFNVFNAYARQNPVFMYYNGGKFYQRSFFSILPTFSYSLKF
ncbi:MAG: TonB-dependent receptor plug domain-containing protein [Bacteroidales bacterium]|nr:TonB-dependent receptor plug domain-containing protein [Bacteroidales bacterium]